MGPTCLLREVIDEYCAALQEEKPASEETRSRYRDTLDTMVRLLGDREIGGYRREDLLSLKTKLYRWPANIDKHDEFRGKTAMEILRMNPAKPLDKRTVDTRYMDKIIAVFQYAFRRGLLAEDITRSVVKTATVAEKKAARRKPYDVEDLKKMIASLPVHPERPHLAWIPLIALYSGARHGELCCLRTTDIHGDQPIPYMVVTEEDDSGKVVTTPRGNESRRIVPIHPQLVELGLLQFVSQRKSRGRELLFERQAKGSDEYIPLTGEYYGQTFEAFNRKHITNDLRKSFYSFRSNVHQALQQRAVPPELCFAITGHVSPFDSEPIAPDDQRLAARHHALVQLAYPGVELTELKEKLRRLLG